VQNVVRVGCDDQLLGWQERRRFDEVEVRVEEVGDLRKDAGPVDGVDGGEAVGLIDFGVGEERLDKVLWLLAGETRGMVCGLTWQSSNVPSTAKLCTLASMTVVICASWMALTLPCGNMMKTETSFFPRRP
jgi:hypothetical protein